MTKKRPNRGPVGSNWQPSKVRKQSRIKFDPNSVRLIWKPKKPGKRRRTSRVKVEARIGHLVLVEAEIKIGDRLAFNFNQATGEAVICLDDNGYNLQSGHKSGEYTSPPDGVVGISVAPDEAALLCDEVDAPRFIDEPATSTGCIWLPSLEVD